MENICTYDGSTVQISKETDRFKRDTENENGHDGLGETISSTVEYLLELSGSPGRWNYFVFFLAFLGGFPLPFQQLSYQFLGYTPDFWCHIETLRDANWTTEQIIDIAIPRNEDGSLEGCKYLDYNYTKAVLLGYDAVKADINLISSGSNATLACPAREFNTTEYSSTITTEWDLVCDRRALYSTTQGATTGIFIFSSYVSGYLSDIFGRRRMAIIDVSILLMSGVATALSTNIWMYISLKMIFSIFSCYTSTFVLALELCTISQRSYVGNLFALPWAIGYMILPVICYYVRSWRNLQLALTAPVLVLVFYYWWLPESPRWLIHQGRFNEALKVLKNAAAWNRQTLPSDQKLIDVMTAIKSKADIEGESEERSLLRQVTKAWKKFMGAFTTRKMVLRTCIILFCWYSVSFIYYGVSLGATIFNVNLYFYVFLGGLLELPSYLFLCPATAFLGRKKTFVFLYILCAVSILGALDASNSHVTTVCSLVSKFAITAAYQLAFLYTGELYGTETRTTILGLCNSVSGIGSLTAPYINDLMGVIDPTAPYYMFGIVAGVSAFLTLFLPETRKAHLPESMADLED
ncbi:solute carrier family 22 member 7-like [Oratosquilla oratoria]|uniref:solute carrier family 22 member 7-like n=1 Tax=Oratosquilla oratoria TaxID=337810 RepID=UPI003F7710A1